MAMQNTLTTDAAWVQLGGTLTVAVVQAKGDHLIHIGSVAPADAVTVGFFIKSGIPLELPQLTALGGKVWARAYQGVGSIVHAVA